jgi:alcohol dehydrogenase class IV
VAEDFRFADGERLIRFGEAGLAELDELLPMRGFDRYALLTTERALAVAPQLSDKADVALHVSPGPVPEAAAELIGRTEGRALVALGGGRVIDTAKAIAGATGVRCAAVPTTLSGAEMTGFHRMPAGTELARLVRPALVVSVPSLMAAQVEHELAASAMNALAHAMEALYTPLANPVSNLAALRGAGLLAQGIEPQQPDREALALGATLAGYASGVAGFAVHHAVCQTIVRIAGTPHAATNAVMLPHSVELMSSRAPQEIAKFGIAIGAGPDPDAAAARVGQLSAKCGYARLGELGLTPDHLPAVLDALESRPDIAQNTPGAPTLGQLEDLLEAAL